MGRNCNATVTPSATPLPVRLRTSQFWATVCIHVPDIDTSCPIQNSRKFRTRSDRKVVVAAARTGRGRRLIVTGQN